MLYNYINMSACLSWILYVCKLTLIHIYKIYNKNKKDLHDFALQLLHTHSNENMYLCTYVYIYMYIYIFIYISYCLCVCV